MSKGSIEKLGLKILEQAERIKELEKMIRGHCDCCEFARIEEDYSLTCDKKCSQKNPIYSLTYWKLKKG